MSLNTIEFIQFKILAMIKVLADLIASIIFELKNTSAFLTCIAKTFLFFFFQNFELSNMGWSLSVSVVYTPVHCPPFFVRMSGIIAE